MLGAAFMVAFVGVFAWGCLAIIARHYGLLLPLFHPAIAIAVNFGGPVLLILGAGFSWLRARTWRKMSVLRVTPPGGVTRRTPILRQVRARNHENPAPKMSSTGPPKFTAIAIAG